MRSWFGRGPDLYVTRGGSVSRLGIGWTGSAGELIGGPFGSLDEAMDWVGERLGDEPESCRDAAE